ncbi:MAG TPA: hypothetical protein DHV28_12490 [Ignavibacteriales bacterium]|nr:hypothetical protein [Ignavibacteriales bacterium]
MKKNKSIALIEAYLFAKKYIIKRGYFSEIEWQDNRDYNNIRYRDLINEAIWVILSAGLSYKVVSKKFSSISMILEQFENLDSLVKNKKNIRRKILNIFNNDKKVDAIFTFIDFLNDKGVEQFKKDLIILGETYLLELPFFGPATSRHFLKNIGISISKPDRHLLRISNLCGFKSVDSLCSYIEKRTEEKKSVIDLVIWRYATIDKNYLFNIENHLVKSSITF